MTLFDKYSKRYGKAFAKQCILEYMKKKKYDSVDELLKNNPTLQEFAKNSLLVGIIRTHGYCLNNDAEYKEILEELKLEEQKKNKLATENLFKTIVNGHELVTYKDEMTGKQVVVDNTVSNRSVENQMKDIQAEHAQFRSAKENNTLNIMNYMEDKVKITPDVVSSENISINTGEEDERQIALAAKAFEREIGHHVDIDLNSKIIYDNGMIYSIEKRGDTYQVFAQGPEPKEKKKEGQQLVMKKQNPNTLPKAS